MRSVRVIERTSAWAAAALSIAVSGASLGCVRSIELRADNWWSARTAHVRLQTDTGHDRAHALAERLETQVQVLRAAFYRCATDDPNPIDVTVLARSDESAPLLGEDAQRGRSLRAVDGLVALPARLLLSDPEISDGVEGTELLSHEITHRFVDTCFHDAPMWLQEGLASVFETAFARQDEVVLGTPRYRILDDSLPFVAFVDGRALHSVPRFLVPSPSELVVMSDDRFRNPDDPHFPGIVGHEVGPRTARLARYAGAFALVHYLALGPDPVVRARFVEYLSALSQGTAPPEAAFHQAFAGVDLDARVDAFTRLDRYRVTTRSLPPIVVASPEVVAMSPAEAHLRLAELALSVGGPRARVRALPHLARASLAPTTQAEALIVAAALATPEEAARRVRAAHRIAPDDREVLRARLLIAQREHDDATAERMAAQLATHHGLSASDLVLVAEVERANGRLDEARAHVRLAIQIDRGYWPSWLTLARVARARHEWRTARRALEIVESLAGHASAPAVREAREGIAAIDRVDRVLSSSDGPRTAPGAPSGYEELLVEAP
jgi:hypothetical protein